MNKTIKNISIQLISCALLSTPLFAEALPRLPEGKDPKTFVFKEQKSIANLPKAYVSMSPKDLGDGLEVGTLDVPGSKEAIEALVADDKAGKYENLDSLLVWSDGKLVFEMYNRRGRVDAPHYTMSITKTITSVLLSRAIQKGILSMEDLDKPIISFLPEIDRSKIQPGTDTITLRDALSMKSGLVIDKKKLAKKSKGKTKQQYIQALFESTEPVTPESKVNKYTGINPTMILMVIEAKAPGSVEEFCDKELMQKIGGIYFWPERKNGIPFGGVGCNASSRTLLKIGTTVFQGGKYHGEQLLSPDYVKLIMDRNVKSGFYYHFHKRHEYSPDKKKIDFISGVGSCGQYMSIYPDLNIVVVTTATGQIKAPLKAVKEHILPLFIKESKK